MVVVLALAMFQVILPVAFVVTAIRVSVDSIAISLFSYPLALVGASIFFRAKRFLDLTWPDI